MRSAPHGPRKRRLAALTALLVVCVLAMVSLSQCVNVADNLTGVRRGEVDYHGGGASSCFRDCQERYKAAVEAEEELHEQNLEECHNSADVADILKGRDHDKKDKKDKNGNGNGHGDGNGHGHGKDRECIQQEKERHREALEQIRQDRRDCQASCHHQGGGSGR